MDNSDQARLIESSSSNSNSNNNNNNNSEKRMPLSRSLTQPQGTIEYVVEPSDTLASVAARHQTVPSEVARINKITGRFIFPGQVLYVPKRTASNSFSATRDATIDVPPNTPNNDLLQQQQQRARSKTVDDDGSIDASEDIARPGQAKRILYGAQLPSNESDLRHIQVYQRSSAPIAVDPIVPKSTKAQPVNIIDPADRECLERFLKINVRHITDGQGVVSGVLLVTPNALMFDPNVSDPLVIEHGTEVYGVTVPTELVLKTALYSDIAHMRTKHAPEAVPSVPKPSVFHAAEGTDTSGIVEENLKGNVYASAKTVSSELEQEADDNKPNNQQIVKNASQEEKSQKEGEKEHKLVRPLISFEDEEARDAAKVSDCKPNSAQSVEDAEPKTEADDPSIESSKREDSLKDEDKEAESPKPSSKPLNTLHSQFQAKLALSERHSAPLAASGENNNKITPLVTAVSADESAGELDELGDNGRRSAHAESRREQMLKRFSNPVDTIGSLTKSGLNSSINATKSGFNATKTGLSSGINATKSGISSGIGFTKTGINAGLNVTKTGFNKVLSTPKNIMDFSSGLVRDAKGALGSKSDTDLAELASDESIEGSRNQSKKETDSTGTIGYTNMVDMKIDAFDNFDKLIPRPARMSKDTPLYLCIRMGKRKREPGTRSSIRGHRFSPTYAFGRKKYEREYWFSVPKDKAHNLYHFFKKWAPEIYGDVDDIQGCESRGLEPMATDDEEEEEEEDEEEKQVDDAKESVENDSSANKTKFWRRRGPINFLKLMEDTFSTDGMSTDWNVSNSSDDHSFMERFRMDTDEPILPDLIGKTELLTEDMIRNLAKHLPARAEGYAWTQIYSTSLHGFSLNSLYREMKHFDTPVLLLIEDTNGAKFGALLSTILQISDHFYGTGETFLFTFFPEFACYPWTGENLFFIKGNTTSVSIGAGEGCFGLWLDGDLYHGSSHPCKTFGNGTLSSEEDFVVKSIECWGFV